MTIGLSSFGYEENIACHVTRATAFTELLIELPYVETTYIV